MGNMLVDRKPTLTDLLVIARDVEGQGVLEPLAAVTEQAGKLAVGAVGVVEQNGRKAVAASVVTVTLIGGGALPAAAEGARNQAVVVGIVQPGDTLDARAQYLGVTSDRLATDSGFPDPDKINPGQPLILDRDPQPASTPGESAGNCAPGEHRAKPGENATGIVQHHDVESLEDFGELNGLGNIDLVFAGKCYKVEAVRQVTIQPGNTFSEIAVKKGVSESALQRVNPHIKDINKIYPGGIINLPASANKPALVEASTSQSMSANITVAPEQETASLAQRAMNHQYVIVPDTETRWLQDIADDGRVSIDVDRDGAQEIVPIPPELLKVALVIADAGNTVTFSGLTTTHERSGTTAAEEGVGIDVTFQSAAAAQRVFKLLNEESANLGIDKLIWGGDKPAGTANLWQGQPHDEYSPEIQTVYGGTTMFISAKLADASPVIEAANTQGEAADPISISQEGLEVIMESEGWRPELYNDPAGHATIGYGRLVHKGPINGSEPEELKAGITEERGMELLGEDVARFETAVRDLVTVPLSQGQLDALVSLAYNIGAGALEDSTLLEKLNEGNYEAAGDEFMRWVNADGRVMGGLVARRTNEVKLWNQEPVQPAVPEAVEPVPAPETAGSDPRLLHPLIDQKQEISSESNGVKTVLVDGIRIRVEAALNLARLLEHADKDGLNLGSSPRGAFRSTEEQAELRVENGCGDVYSMPASSCRIPTAPPGESNHESHPDDPDSYAVDFRNDGTRITSWRDPAAKWLKENGPQYGFFGEIPVEPWHWSGTGT